MTIAVCFNCGVIKFGAFVRCPKCSCGPQSEHDLAISLAMTDHYFDMATLEEMGTAVREGSPWIWNPHFYRQIVEVLRRNGTVAKYQRGAVPTESGLEENKVTENGQEPDS